MANRYLRATGNWNGPVWAETSSGTAGSAATPGEWDTVIMAANYTLTMNMNATVGGFSHQNGTFNLGSYKLSVLGVETGPTQHECSFESIGTTSRTINLGSGTLETEHNDYDGTDFKLSGSNLTFNAGTSQVIINAHTGFAPYTGTISTGSKTFYDVYINFKNPTTTGYPDNPSGITITGSPRFNTLLIKSNDSEAHAVSFEKDASIIVDKLILVGTSAEKKLTIKNTANDFVTVIAPNSTNSSTCYGRNVALEYISGLSWANNAKGYIGSNSTALNSFGWLLQDPPKISTLVDPLTTAPGSNTNWMVSNAVTQVSNGLGGGGYSLGYLSDLYSAGTYDLYDHEMMVEINGANLADDVAAFGFGPGGISVNQDNLNSGVSIAVRGRYWTGSAYSNIWKLRVKVGAAYISEIDLSSAVPSAFSSRYLFKFKVQTNRTVKLSVSSNGGATWSEFTSAAIPVDYMDFIRSIRVDFNNRSSAHPLVVGSVNVPLNQAPSVVLNTANNKTFSTKTPTLEFTGTDPDGNTIMYQVQIDTVNTFDSQGGA